MTSAVAVSLATVLALSPPEVTTARRLFDAGSLAYERGRFDDASRAFEAAYELLPEPAIAFSLAQAHRRQYFVGHDSADLERAIELFRRYLAEVPEGKRRADAVDQLQQLELVPRQTADDASRERAQDQRSTELVLYANGANAQASVDDGDFVAVPTIVATTPGTHRVRMRAPGYLVGTTAAIAVAGRMMPVTLQLAEAPAHLRLHTRPGATIVVDGRVVGRAPLSAALELSAGPHALVVRAPGRITQWRPLRLAREQSLSLGVALPRTRQRTAALALLGTGAGLWLAGATTVGLAFGFQRRARRIDDLRGDRNIDGDELDMLERDLAARDRLRGASIGLLTGAAVSTIVGVVLYVTDRG